MVYIPGSAGQIDHQPRFGRDSPEPQLVRPARDRQTPAELFRISTSNSPTTPHIKGTELDLGCLRILVPKAISPPGVVRARGSALAHRDLVHTTSSKLTRAQTLTFLKVLLKGWMQEPPYSSPPAETKLLFSSL